MSWRSDDEERALPDDRKSAAALPVPVPAPGGGATTQMG